MLCHCHLCSERTEPPDHLFQQPRDRTQGPRGTMQRRESGPWGVARRGTLTMTTCNVGTFMYFYSRPRPCPAGVPARRVVVKTRTANTYAGPRRAPGSGRHSVGGGHYFLVKIMWMPEASKQEGPKLGRKFLVVFQSLVSPDAPSGHPGDNERGHKGAPPQA